MLLRMTAIAAAFAGATFVTAPAEAQNVTIKSDFCRKAYKDLASKSKPRAMAASKDGMFCHSVWGAKNQSSANQQALNGCARSGRACVVVRR
jgi:hypothetical protein